MFKNNKGMQRYKNLRLIRDHIVLLPGLVSYKDFDISIEIGHHEYLGSPLTIKQLLLLDIAGESTVRRHLNSLVQRGLVVKVTNPGDGRSVELRLTDKAHALFADAVKNLRGMLDTLT